MIDDTEFCADYLQRAIRRREEQYDALNDTCREILSLCKHTEVIQFKYWSRYASKCKVCSAEELGDGNWHFWDEYKFFSRGDV